ncbi:MAG: hypothetical protein ACHQIL_07090 [Steroidobacterales bacterium]
MTSPDTPGARPGPGSTQPLDQAFIEANKLIERYLENKLPYKGQRDLENWCRANPQLLRDLRLSERTVASLKLLEASGSPPDLSEPRTPWWKKPHALIAACLVALAALAACAILMGKLTLLRGRLEDAQTQLKQGALVPPAAARSLRIQPDRAAGIDSAKLTVNHSVAQLIDLGIDLSYSSEKRFRVTIDKRDQARALVLGALTKDSNGDLRVTFNTSALGSGMYDVHIQALPLLGAPTDAGWLILDVR